MMQFIPCRQQFSQQLLLIQHEVPDAGKGQAGGEKGDEAHEGFPVDEIGPRIRMVGESVGDIPANCRTDRHGNAFFATAIPSGYGNRYEVENEKSEFVTGEVVQPTQGKQDNNTEKHYSSPALLERQRVRITPPFSDVAWLYHYALSCSPDAEAPHGLI